MKNTLIGLGVLLVLVVVTSDATAQRGRGNGQGQGQGQGRGKGQGQGQGQAGQSQRNNLGATPRGNQSRQTTNALPANGGGLDLLRMREEEKLARDVYTSLAKSSRQVIFQNISRAESQHMQALERLIRSSGNAANLGNTPGVFAYPDYQQLYTTLVASGSQSPLDALMVGAKIEEMDIADLQRLLKQTVDPQARQILEHLMRGSENHLRAFASQLAKQGASYKAEFLTQTQFDQIANSSGSGQGRQSAGHGANGAGRGKMGQGNAGQGFGQQGLGQQRGGQQRGGQQRGGQQGRGRGNSGR